MKYIKGGVTAPKGFLAGAASCGIKKSKRPDLALLVSQEPALCAGTFTTNKVRSGSVDLCEERVKKGKVSAVIVNSGNANCCAGKSELEDASGITALVAKNLDLNKEAVLICSTGIIGRPLPVNKIKRGIGSLVKDLANNNGSRFSKAIMTTDTIHKEAAIEIKIGGKTVRIGAAAKGSGMICPSMATMLAFFTTDAAIEKMALKEAFKEAVADSFNRITVDGDMSTNDTAIVLANATRGNKIIRKDSPDYFRFLNGLKFIATQLAKKIILDGEGATKFVEVAVKGAKTQSDAEKVARHVADSNLVKTMIRGGDPNWGRVAASVGSSGVNIKQKKLNIYFGKTLVMKNGRGAKVSRSLLLDIFKKKEIDITIHLKSGKASSKIWTCDLTEEYVRINAEYET